MGDHECIDETHVRINKTSFLTFPPLHWLPKYKKEWIVNDILSGLSLATILIPQSIAYAFLANLPPQHGLYASIWPIFIYALFGNCHQLSIGIMC